MNFLIILTAKYLYLVIIAVFLVFIAKSSSVLKTKLLKTSLLTLPFALVLLKIAARLYYDPRPFVVNHLTPLIAHAVDNGFPSDHTLLCAVLTVIVFLYNRKLSAFLFFLTLLVGSSRVLAQVHHPIDIVGSIVIALISILPSYFLFYKS